MRRKKHASMSFLTSLGLSFNNLRTKKGRTIMTAFAGSIGIIGIALILSLSGGVNVYIQNIEESTMAEYPIQVTSASLDISALMSSMSGSGEEEDGDITVTEIITTIFSGFSSNDLTSLKEYLDSGESDMEEYTKSIEYSYDTEPILYLRTEDGPRQVNPDLTLSDSSSVMAAMMSSNLATFYVMPENEELYRDQYEVMAGRWPENYDECILVLSQDGSISDYMLYSLGLRDFDELDAIVEQFDRGGEIEAIEGVGSYSYEDILGITYKVICPSDLYAYDEEYGVWVDKSDNADYVDELVAGAEDLTVVGVVQPIEDAIGASLTTGINYPVSLVYHVSELAADSTAVQAQMADPDVNIFTGEPFGEEAEFDFDAMFSIDEDALAELFDLDDVMSDFDLGDMDLDLDFSDMDLGDMDLDLSDMDLSSMDLDLSGMDLSGMDLDLSGMDLSGMSMGLSGMDLGDLTGGITVDTSGMSDLAEYILAGYSGSRYTVDFDSYLKSDEAADVLQKTLGDPAYTTVTVDSDGLAEAIEAALTPEDGDEETDVDALADAIAAYVSENAAVTVSGAGLDALSDGLATGYADIVNASFTDYLNSDGVRLLLTAGIMSMLDLSGFEASLTDAMGSYMESAVSQMTESYTAALSTQMTALTEQMMTQMMSSITEALTEQMSVAMESVMTDVMTEVTEQITEQISSSMDTAMTDVMEGMADQMAEAMEDALNIDSDALTDSFEFNMGSSDLLDLLASMSSGSTTSYSGNLSSLGWVDFSTPTEIDIYPSDFESKDHVVAILDDYNDRMNEAGETEKVITYTDMVATMMSSVTTIVNVVSYVLIAFFVVSLIVSCIMISIITQISVLERTKEIGILRAMGASRRNISAVFNAETFIIGLFSGLIGVIVSELLIIPINALIHRLMEDNSVNAILSLRNAAILVLISIAITVFSGLVPALRAARKDPVTALRTE